MHFLGEINVKLEIKIQKYILSKQNKDGGWPLFFEGESDISARQDKLKDSNKTIKEYVDIVEKITDSMDDLKEQLELQGVDPLTNDLIRLPK